MIFRRSITLIAVLIVFVLFGQIARRVKPINSKAGAVVRTNIKGGTVVPGVKPYTLSPFLTDIVLESTSKTTRIYDGVDLTSLSGEMDRSVRLYSPGAARISIAAKLGAPHFTPRAFLYDERNQMMAMLRQEKSEDLITWAFDIPSSGLYRLNLKFSLAAVRSIDLSTELEKTDVSYEDFVAQNVKGFEIDIAPAQLDRLNEIRLERKAMWADHVEGVKWQRRESPSERVVARIRSSGGNWAIASLGLSGRNSAHSSDLALPSLDLKIVSGSLPYGLRRFKLYVLKSKGFGRDLVHESILQDHGIVMPHGDLVQVSLNEGEPLFMELLAGMDSHLFEHAQRTEGAVLGYDVDALIATSFDNRLKSKNYFSKIKFNSDRFGTFSTESFAENVCEVPFLSVISY
ncbi:MAG: hypothetical protein KDD53_06195, partial [Bdellovibrionales bacterium]|nr:hypothetical protein [Bdellovibrionales bacterium]